MMDRIKEWRITMMRRLMTWAAGELSRLVKSRSTHQVERMERERGLL